MNIKSILRELVAERERVDEAIADLEGRALAMVGCEPARRGRGRRGRTGMPPHERLEVSRRMRAYWEARRATRISAGPRIPDRGSGRDEALRDEALSDEALTD